MTNQLIEAITKTLYKNSKCRTYIDEIKQGFKEPCFFIENKSTVQTKGYGKRRLKENLIVINYFPSDNLNKIQEINEICDELYRTLEYISFDEKHIIRGRNMNHSISDGVLVFTVTYAFCMTEKTDKIYMDSLKQNFK